jgi:hypothetical protein
MTSDLITVKMIEKIQKTPKKMTVDVPTQKITMTIKDALTDIVLLVVNMKLLKRLVLVQVGDKA